MNPYSASAATLQSAEPVPHQLGLSFWIVSVGVTILSILLGLLGVFAAPAFETAYASFGFTLSVPTVWLINNRYGLWLSSVVALGLWGAFVSVSSRWQFRKRFLVGFFMLGILTVCLFVYAIWALYLPMEENHLIGQ
jgi:hypothetical protein